MMDDLFADMDALVTADELETTRQLDRPLVYARREAKRQFINGLRRQALTDLIPTLPPPDTDLYVVGNGAGAERRSAVGGIAECFDFGTFIPHLVEMLGGQGCIAHVSTWVMNRNHALNLIEMLDDGRIARLTVLTDPYFKTREAANCATLITGMQRHGQRARFLALKNHVKAICIASADGSRTATVTGSANLSAQPRCEQYVLTTDPGVYQFFVTQFFEALTNG
jgi:hypothetical protein